MKRGPLIILCFILLYPLGLSAASPWQQHGALQASKNGHAIQHKDGTPFLWMGDTAWGLFQQLKREEVDHYLDHRQKLGFNVIQSVAFWYPHGGGIASGPHNAANAYGHRPFAGGDDSPNTAAPLVVRGGSPTQPNDYWDHVNYVVNAIKKRNMYLALLPCWGRAYVSGQMGGSHAEFSVSEARSYGTFLGQRLKQEPHVLWVLGGDAKARINGPDKHGKFQKWDTLHIFRAMAEGIAHGVTGQKPGWAQAHPAWKRLFMTYHPDGDAADNSSKWFHKDAWLTANGVEVWKEVDQVYSTMLKDYRLSKPTKPSLFLEGSYEYGSYKHECGWVTPLKMRRQVYHTFFAGGAGHTYGAGPIWAMRGTGDDYNCGYTWKQGLELPGGAQFARLTKSFLQMYQWSKWRPEPRIVRDGRGKGESLKVAVTHTSGQMSLVYFSNNSNALIKNTLGTLSSAHWFDPREARLEDGGSFNPNQVRRVSPPAGWEDAILILRAKD